MLKGAPQPAIESTVTTFRVCWSKKKTMTGNLDQEEVSRLEAICNLDSSEFSQVSRVTPVPDEDNQIGESSSCVISNLEVDTSQWEGGVVDDVDLPCDILVSQEHGDDHEEEEQVGDEILDDAIQIMLLPKNEQDDVEEAPCPKLINSLISKQMSEMSTRDREEAYFDVHGVSGIVDEEAEPGFVDRKLTEMQQELEIFDPAEKNAYFLAYNANPQYVLNRDLRLRFLRADQFDAKMAAQRYINHYETKLELFGAETLGRDIIQDDMDDETLAAVYCSLNQLLPQRDRAGRAIILFVQDGRQQSYSPEAIMRRAFYNVMLTTDDTETQRKGVTICVYACRTARGIGGGGINRTWKVGHCFKSLPIRVVGFHFCYSSLLSLPVMSTLQLALDLFSRVRFRAHRGSHSECMYSLQTFGIPTNVIPIDEQGEILTKKYRKFLTGRRKQEQKWKRSQSQRPGSTINQSTMVSLSYQDRIVVPSSYDVLFGRGKGYFNHIGNIRYRSLIEDLKEKYDKSKRNGKKQITFDVVETIHKSGGRFLKEDGDGGSGSWVLVEAEVARSKVSHSFRAIRAPSSSSLQEPTNTAPTNKSARNSGMEEGAQAAESSHGRPGSKRTRAC